MTPTPELKALLLKELSTHHDLKKLCLTWDIENINDYISLTTSSEPTENKLLSEVKNFAETLTLIVASSITVPALLSPSATTIVVAPPDASTSTGAQP